MGECDLLGCKTGLDRRVALAVWLGRAVSPWGADGRLGGGRGQSGEAVHVHGRDNGVRWGTCGVIR